MYTLMLFPFSLSSLPTCALSFFTHQAVRTSEGAINPVYVSVGHKISLDTAIKLVVACSVKRVPEPVRQVHTQTHTTCMTL